ncbi:hypothetical protein BDR06DRAFT_1004754 [Suillus hirtellus]|nr:hypothetical protein BDR06DRAFT_1004754 [Suillus hirtellus]
MTHERVLVVHAPNQFGADWTTIVNDNPRIKHHLRFHKMVNYRHVTSFGVMEPIASGFADVKATSSTLPLMPLWRAD